MNPKVIFTFLLLAMLTSQAFSWWGRRRRRRPSTSSSCSGSSPAGGPSSNPNAVVCNFYRSSNYITCRKGMSSQYCFTQPPDVKSDTQSGGPTPLGEYLIGKRYTHRRLNIDWYQLNPKKENNCGYYSYLQKTATGRYAMALHPGTVSLGCVTVKAPTYNSDPCWKKIRAVIDSGNMYYRFKSYSGFLFVR